MTLDPATTAQLTLRDRPEGRRPVMKQTWSRLLFLHWRFEPDVVRPTIPDGLTQFPKLPG